MKSIFKLALVALISTTTFAQNQTGKASFYADKFEGRTTASGEKYKHSKLTAAHKTLPFGTRVKVTNKANQKVVEVVINDRGPYVDGRIIDLSRSAAEKLDFINQGLADVIVEVLDAGDGKGSGQVKPVVTVVEDEKEFYDFEVERLAPTGFGIQIGTYQELVNLMRIADNLKSSYEKKVSVQVKVVNGLKYYGIIVGQFSTRTKADAFKEKVKKKFPDAFTVEFGKL
jgi:rare lipoprotein A